MIRLSLVLVFCCILFAPKAFAQTGATPAFTETFDLDPASPGPWNPDNWDVTVHVRSRDNYYSLEPVEADHGSDCGPPPATHMVSAYEDMVYSCKNHMMTTLNAPGYGVIYLTPNHLLDFSETTGTVSFDMSTLRKTGRDWVDVWITPFEDHLQLPLDGTVDLQGLPKRGINITMDLVRGTSRFRAYLIENHEATELDATSEGWQGYEAFLTPDQRRRDQFELKLTRTHLSFGMPGYSFQWFDLDIPELSWDRAVIQFGHHSYNPYKDCDNDGSCAPNTWHWDNVSIAPAQPFTMLHATKRYADASTAGVVQFETPAPQAAYLRFAGIGNNISLSFDNGATWGPAVRQPQILDIEEHFSSYLTPIPAGTSNILVQAEDWWGGPWHVRNLSIWSQEVATSVNTETPPRPATLVLHQNFPNPVHTSTVIPLTVPNAGYVRLEVIDILGRTVAVAQDGILAQGGHDIPFNARALPAGTYFYRVTTETARVTRLLQVIR
ncbi:MAG: T9SS type A sorting domain-containing protein [Bacteroidota bacterium]